MGIGLEKKMKSSPKKEYDDRKLYVVTIKLIKRGDKVDEFIKEMKKRKDWTPPYFVEEKLTEV